MLDVYLEIGAKRVFACAVDWPGFCRSGPDEAAALQALLDYAQRYAAVIRTARPSFKAPSKPGELRAVERLRGNATTDFGAPGMIPSGDRIVPPLSAAALADPQRGLRNVTRLDVPLGHIGMVVSGRARELCWTPLIDWLKVQ